MRTIRGAITLSIMPDDKLHSLPPRDWQEPIRTAYSNGEFPRGSTLLEGKNELTIHVPEEDKSDVKKLLTGMIIFLERHTYLSISVRRNKQGRRVIFTNIRSVGPLPRVVHGYKQLDSAHFRLELFCPQDSNCDCVEVMKKHIQTTWSFRE